MVLTDVSGQSIGPIFKGQSVQEECRAASAYVIACGKVWALICSRRGKGIRHVVRARSYYKVVGRAYRIDWINLGRDYF